MLSLLGPGSANLLLPLQQVWGYVLTRAVQGTPVLGQAPVPLIQQVWDKETRGGRMAFTLCLHSIWILAVTKWH